MLIKHGILVVIIRGDGSEKAQKSYAQLSLTVYKSDLRPLSFPKMCL